MPDFRRGAEEIAKAKSKASSGGFTPFAPEIFWGKDGAKRYVLFLNPITEIPTVDMINMIPIQKKVGDQTREFYERVIARTDPSVGENSDPMNKDWDYRIQDYCVAVAVELEPTVEEVRGRARPTGFAIKLNEYTRRVRDEDTGDLTDDTEDVTVPAIGFIHQSPHNFFNMVTAFDSENAEIERTPLKITQVGEKTDTAFDVTGYPEFTVDLEPLLEYIDGFSYLTDDERKKLVADVDEIEDDLGAALLIGEVLLNKRLTELHDQERYDKIYAQIDKPAKYGVSKKEKGKKGGKSESNSRPSRRSSRRSKNEDEAPAEPEAQETTPEPEAEEKPRRRRGAAKTEDKQSDPKAMSNLDRLRKQTADRQEKAEATA